MDILRTADQPVRREPARWEQRQLAPLQPGRRITFIRGIIEPGVAGTELGFPSFGDLEYLAVERGALTLTLDGEAVDLQAGDSVCYEGAYPRALSNPGPEPCVYYLAVFKLRDQMLSHLR